ncbi:MAG: hypothetical protein QXQ53_01305 [Candidatus Methanosuratincola sp.]
MSSFMKYGDKKREWTTENEIEFVNSLPLDTLRRYKETMVLRVRWGDIDRERVVKEIERLLKGGEKDVEE